MLASLCANCGTGSAPGGRNGWQSDLGLGAESGDWDPHARRLRSVIQRRSSEIATAQMVTAAGTRKKTQKRTDCLSRCTALPKVPTARDLQQSTITKTRNAVTDQQMARRDTSGLANCVPHTYGRCPRLLSGQGRRRHKAASEVRSAARGTAAKAPPPPTPSHKRHASNRGQARGQDRRRSSR